MFTQHSHNIRAIYAITLEHGVYGDWFTFRASSGDSRNCSFWRLQLASFFNTIASFSLVPTQLELMGVLGYYTGIFGKHSFYSTCLGNMNSVLDHWKLSFQKNSCHGNNLHAFICEFGKLRFCSAMSKVFISFSDATLCAMLLFAAFDWQIFLRSLGSIFLLTVLEILFLGFVLMKIL